MKDAEAYSDLILKTLGEIREIDPEEINPEENFTTMGLTSTDALRTLKMFKDELNMDVSPAILFEYPNVNALARYLAENTKQ